MYFLLKMGIFHDIPAIAMLVYLGGNSFWCLLVNLWKHVHSFPFCRAFIGFKELKLGRSHLFQLCKLPNEPFKKKFHPEVSRVHGWSDPPWSIWSCALMALMALRSSPQNVDVFHICVGKLLWFPQHLMSQKLAWQWKITIFNRRHSNKWLFFHCQDSVEYVELEARSHGGLV